MSSVIPLLSNVKVAAPCSASWQSMEEVDGDRVHFCGDCKKNVYNLSAMTQTQAEGLLREHEGHLCVRYYKRADGTILTQNCPVGQAALRMQMIARSKRAALAAAALTTATIFGMAAASDYSNAHVMGQRERLSHPESNASGPTPIHPDSRNLPESAEPERALTECNAPIPTTLTALEPIAEQPPVVHTQEPLAEMGEALAEPVPEYHPDPAKAVAQSQSLIEAPDPELRPPDSQSSR